MEHSLISDIAICIMVAWVLAFVAQLLKQPLILAYLIAGFAVGPVGFHLIKGQESVGTISELGLILLLFMIGLEMDLKKILGAGRLITVTAASQVLGGCLLGLLFFKLLAPLAGLARLDILYLAVAAALSSTVIIVKILYDRRELDTLPGRITLGVLVLQDVFAILFLAVQPNLQTPQFAPLAISLAKAVLVVAVAFTASRYILPPLFKVVARLPELVQVGALAWCFLVAGLANVLGLSREMGALIAGMAISTFPYTLDVVAKVTTLRDFFVTLFFVGLGMAIPAPTLYFIGWALVFAGFLVASRLATVFIPLQWMRQGHRAGLLPAIYLSQVSEFSLVILTLGAAAGHISKSTEGIVAYAFALLAVLSTYGILQSNRLVGWLSPLLRRWGVGDLDEHTDMFKRSTLPPRIFLLGCHWTGSSFLEDFLHEHPESADELLVIDFHPQVHKELRQRGIPVVYGDISQRDTLYHAGIEHAEIILCTLPNTMLKGTSNLKLAQQLRELNPHATLIVQAETLADVNQLYAAGVNYVCLPRLLAATDLVDLVHAARNQLLDERRAQQMTHLHQRQETLP
jgi:Kef-type K+ transport system membrane component KefB